MKVKIFRKIAFLCGLMVLLYTGMPALAAPKTMPDGQLFDPQYYAKTYPMIDEVAQGNETLLYAHYVQCGKDLGFKPYDEESLNSGVYEYNNQIFNLARDYKNSNAGQGFGKVSAIDTINGMTSDREWLMHVSTQKMKAGKHYATATDKHGWNSPIPATSVDFVETFGFDMKNAKNNWDACMKMMQGQGFSTDLDSYVETSAKSINDHTIRHEFEYKNTCAASQNLLASIDYDSIDKISVRLTIDQTRSNSGGEYYNMSFLDCYIYYKKAGKSFDKYICYTF